jgi:hypothetical protein
VCHRAPGRSWRDRRALDIGISQGPVVRFSWDGWHVVGDLRPDDDPYVATRGTKRVRWRF